MEDLSSTTERLLAHLFEPQEGKALLSVNEQEQVTIYETLYTRWMEDVHLTDAEMVAFAMKEYKCSRRTAYRYIANTKTALSNVRAAGRNWYRHTVVQMLLKAYAMALESRNVRAMIAAAEGIGKYTNLDKPDVEAIDWGRLAPQTFEPTADAALLGISESEQNEFENLRRQLERKYKLPTASMAGVSIRMSSVAPAEVTETTIQEEEE